MTRVPINNVQVPMNAVQQPNADIVKSAQKNANCYLSYRTASASPDVLPTAVGKAFNCLVTVVVHQTTTDRLFVITSWMLMWKVITVTSLRERRIPQVPCEIFKKRTAFGTLPHQAQVMLSVCCCSDLWIIQSAAGNSSLVKGKIKAAEFSWHFGR